jgi:hypothetical protein
MQEVLWLAVVALVDSLSLSLSQLSPFLLDHCTRNQSFHASFSLVTAFVLSDF